MQTNRRTWLTRLASFFGAAAAVKALPGFFDEPCTLATPEQVAERMRPGLPMENQTLMNLTYLTLRAQEDVDKYERVSGQRHKIGTTVRIRKPARFEPWP